MKFKMQHCAYCGEELGEFDNWPREILHCGTKECARDAAADMRAEREEAMFRAEQDDYGAYR